MQTSTCGLKLQHGRVRFEARENYPAVRVVRDQNRLGRKRLLIR